MTLTELPNDIDSLKQLVLDTHQQVLEREDRIAQHEEEIAERETQIKELQSQLAYLKHKLFGRRSEKIDPAQLLLFKELEAQVEALAEDPFCVERLLVETWQQAPAGAIPFDAAPPRPPEDN